MDTQIPFETLLFLCHFTRRHFKESDASFRKDARNLNVSHHIKFLRCLLRHAKKASINAMAVTTVFIRDMSFIEGVIHLQRKITNLSVLLVFKF